MKRKRSDIQDEGRFMGKVTGFKMQSKGNQPMGGKKEPDTFTVTLFPSPHYPIIPTIYHCKLEYS
jgi:hypothetical protein